MRMPIGVRFFYVFICFMNTYCLLVHIVSQNTYPKGKRKMKNSKVQVLVEGAVMVALAAVLSFIRVYRLPWGGSITLLSMLPIAVYSIKRLKGWLCGFLRVLAVPAFPGHHRRTFRLGTYPCNAHCLHSA